jgi:hypothetical protein
LSEPPPPETPADPPEPAADPPGWQASRADVEGLRVSRATLAAGIATVIGVGAILGGTAWGKEQLALSFTKMSEPSVELFFSEPRGKYGCRTGNRRYIGFTLVNHDRAARSFDYVVRITRVAPAPPGSTVVVRGQVRLGREAGRPTRVGVPSQTGQQFSVEVTVVGLPQRIALTCGAQVRR